MRFKHKNIMGLIYTCMLALPFVAILSRVIYVQSNKNAYQSYSNSYVESFNKVNSSNLMIDDNNYLLKISKSEVQSFTSNFTIRFNEISIDIEGETGYQDINMIQYQYGGFVSLQINGNESIFYPFSNPISDIFFGNIYFNNDNTNYYNILSNNLFIITYNNKSLDNVFEYSVNMFIDNNNFGRINFFNWFTDMFLDNNNVNNMYVHFINWYMNYTMLVSATYILFLVLMWFINYVRKLLERGLDYDW